MQLTKITILSMWTDFTKVEYIIRQITITSNRSSYQGSRKFKCKD